MVTADLSLDLILTTEVKVQVTHGLHLNSFKKSDSTDIKALHKLMDLQSNSLHFTGEEKGSVQCNIKFVPDW